MLKSHHWKEWIAVLLLFCTGALVGAGIMRLYMGKARFDLPIGGPAELQHRVLRKLDRELNLNEAQRKAIRRIVEESLHRSTIIRKPIAEKMDALIQEQYEKILLLLNDEQRAKYERLHARFEKRRKAFQWLPPHPPPPPPPPPN